MTRDIAVLVSAGRHPASGRARRARSDAQALELGLRAAAACAARLHVVHAGDPDSPALREYLGMGIESLRVLAVPAHADPVPALAEWLHGLRPALVLTGAWAEIGWSSGCLPYALAAALDDYAIVSGAVDLALGEAAAEIRQALPQGRRRALRVTLPAVVSVDPAAPAARQSAFARARRGRVVVDTPAGPYVLAPNPGAARPARVRAALLDSAQGATAAERLKLLTSGPVQSTQIVQGVPAEEAAARIHALLLERRLVRPVSRDYRADELT